ncbi:DUF6221 family protein [Nonomuraea sp. NPDC049709]|uniref:DUF6221 family protein n=1 Tax=Nonomuraea sp. NPDC049709 TaxID=3154736 RepID=UPI003434CEA7
MSDDLVAFLRARLNEAERMASWARGTIPVRRPGDGSGNVRPLRRADQQALDMYSAAFRPERMLADIAAKRLIVHAHGQAHECISLLDGGDASTVDGKPWEYWEPRDTTEHGPCLVLRCLALPYADHHDYREEWRP